MKSQEGRADIEKWNNIINFDNDGDMKKAIILSEAMLQLFQRVCEKLTDD